MTVLGRSRASIFQNVRPGSEPGTSKRATEAWGERENILVALDKTGRVVSMGNLTHKRKWCLDRKKKAFYAETFCTIIKITHLLVCCHWQGGREAGCAALWMTWTPEKSKGWLPGETAACSHPGSLILLVSITEAAGEVDDVIMCGYFWHCSHMGWMWHSAAPEE